MADVPSMQQLLEAGVHFGHQVRRGHPKMGEYIFGARDGVHIINLEHSEKLLQEAAEFAQKLGEDGKVLLFVGTKKQAQPIVEEVAGKIGAPYMTAKWMAGLLTNFDELKKNINKLADLKVKQDKGELEHYTKKERLLISRKLEKFAKEYGGVTGMDKLPDALFIIDVVSEKTALYEATRMNLPVIGICDTNSNPLLVTKPIPGNDDATKSIKILTQTIADAYAAGLKKAGKSVEQPAKAEAKKDKNDEAKESDVLDETLKAEVEVAEELVEKEEVQDSERIVK